MANRVNTTNYEIAHGTTPRGWGNWFFKDTHGNTICLVGNYSMVSKQARKFFSKEFEIEVMS